MRLLDVLIPTYERPAALAATLVSLALQDTEPFRVIVSDQSESAPSSVAGEVRTAVRVLEMHGHEVVTIRHLPRRGLAEHRDSLLRRSDAEYVLFLDDDVILEPWTVQMLTNVVLQEGCGLAGCAPIGLSYTSDVRPHEQHLELWDGPVEPEAMEPLDHTWDRHRLHNAANVLHVQRRLGATPEAPLRYRLAWIGACVMYDRRALESIGGFGFWEELPEQHAGEDVLVQMRVMRLFGGCGVLPSGAYHQELETTVRDRTVNAPFVLPVFGGTGGAAAEGGG